MSWFIIKAKMPAVEGARRWAGRRSRRRNQYSRNKGGRGCQFIDEVSPWNNIHHADQCTSASPVFPAPPRTAACRQAPAFSIHAIESPALHFRRLSVTSMLRRKTWRSSSLFAQARSSSPRRRPVVTTTTLTPKPLHLSWKMTPPSWRLDGF